MLHKCCEGQFRRKFSARRKKQNSTTEGDLHFGDRLKTLGWSGPSACTGYPQKIHIVTSPPTNCTTLPPTRTLVTASPDFPARMLMKLGRRVSIPCSINPCASGASTACRTAQAAQHPAADPVAGSSPL